MSIQKDLSFPRKTFTGSITGLALVLAVLAFAYRGFLFVRDFSDHRASASILSALNDMPVSLGVHIAGYTLAVSLIHVLVGLIWAFAWIRASRTWPLNAKDRFQLGLLGFLLLFFWILLANARWFPLSLFAMGVDRLAMSALGTIFYFGLGIPIAGIVAFGGLGLLHDGLSRLGARRSIAMVVTSAFVAFLWASPPPNTSHADHVSTGQPNIFIIGVDALRPDHLAPAGAPNPLMPFLSRQLENSAVFSDAYTPFARTYPAWLSVLSGRDPIAHGARYNLTDPNRVDLNGQLTNMLRDHGYTTAFAIDERRFASIDQQHGFDHIIGPAIGAADFLLGAMNDIPLCNLISNTWLGKRLFPFTYSNRGAEVTYRPETFNKELARFVQSHNPKQPLFLAVHFELPHWPYTWADAPHSASDTETAHVELPSSPAQYRQALQRADQQVESFMGELEQHGLLDDAVVVFLSDHGEDFGQGESVWFHGPSANGNRLVAFSGHGTHVMSPAQYRVLLAFRRTGGETFPSGARRGNVSLIDITPTLRVLLGLEHDEKSAGQPLVANLKDASAPLPDRTLFLETGLSPKSITGGNPSAAAAFAEAGLYYRIDERGRVILRNDLVPQLLREKQRAALRDRWLLAALPDQQGNINWVLGDIETSTWWPHNTWAQTDAPIESLMLALCQHYRSDTEFAIKAQCGPSSNATVMPMPPSEVPSRS
ncbi:MAG: sulfatase-like hydrolase/transferase [Pseudomonadota bacterium]|nr:sulfatase-like hydrolase/transferase [Pseudomonadota bacterium]